jgi:hypothetical protein
MGQTSFLFSGFLSSSIWKRADAVLKGFFIFLASSASDPFDGTKPRGLVPLRVYPEQAPAFIPGSRRVDFITGRIIYLDGELTAVA